MNEKAAPLKLYPSIMNEPTGWGREEGRVVYQRLISFIERHPGTTIFRLSLEGVERVDFSFASETVVELARRYRGVKGFCFIDLANPDMRDNWNAAAERKNQPLMSWSQGECWVVGPRPSKGIEGAFNFALERPRVRAAEFAAATDISIANASSKFKKLWEAGFLLRSEETAESGGVEFSYSRIQ